MITANKPITEKPKRRRRGNGEGTIYKRADGRWAGMITVSINGNGRAIRRSTSAATMREVQDKLGELRKHRHDGTLGAPDKCTVKTYLNRWLEDSVRQTARRSTLASYTGIVKNHIVPRIGGVSLAKLSPMQVEWLYGEMERDGLSARLRQLTHAVLRKALNDAVRKGMVPRNVCSVVTPPKPAKRSMSVLDRDQASALLEAAKSDRLHALYVLAVTTGMRLGELFGLQWEDIDLDGSALSVRHTLSEVNGSQRLTEPKTPSSRRRIKLPEMAVDVLHEHRKRMLAEGRAGCRFVFCSRNGTPLRRSHISNGHFKGLLKRAELPEIRFHDLRHTAATLLLLQGVNAKVVSEILGHSDVALTLNVYSHVLPTMQDEAAEKMHRLFARTGT